MSSFPSIAKNSNPTGISNSPNYWKNKHGFQLQSKHIRTNQYKDVRKIERKCLGA